MTLQAKIYIAVVLALGAAACVSSMVAWYPHDLSRASCYLVLAVIASGLKVRLPGITGTMSVLFVILLACVADLGLAETVAIAVLSILVQCYWHAKVRPRAVQILFSVANISSAVWISHFAFHKVAAIVPFMAAAFPLSIAASVFFV